jgi:uncharacterized membrane protein YccC
MPDTPHKRLRRLGTTFLGAAVLMLLCGLTILEPRLRGLAFIAYWCGCFLIVGLAAFMALLDLILTRREARKAQREIFEDSFQGKV